MTASRSAVAALLLALCLSGCLTPAPGPDGVVDTDPLERTNRWVFTFNEGLDRVLIEPLGRGWRFITPRIVRRSIDLALVNLQFPVRAVSTLGQARFGHAGWETVRFVVNSTLGVVGLWDPASRLFGIPFYDEDIGQMMAVWGIGGGPYWVVPLIGPSSPRGLVGYAGDSFLNLLPWYGAPIALINGRAIAVPAVDRAREASLDYYVFVRDAYWQLRADKVADRGSSAPGDRIGRVGGVAGAFYGDDSSFYLDDDDFYELDEDVPEGEVDDVEP